MATTPTREEVRKETKPYQAFTLVRGKEKIRQQLQPGVTSAMLQRRNRDARICEYLPFFLGLLKDRDPQIQAICLESDRRQRAGLSLGPYLYPLVGPDNVYNDPEDLTPALLSRALQVPRLKDMWVKAFIERVSQSSRALRNALTDCETRGERLELDMAIVGGGPMTAIGTSIAGRYRRVTVITDGSFPAENWFGRKLHINNSSSATNPFGPGTPVQDGSTTRVYARGLVNNIDPSALDSNSSLECNCDDGTSVRYISGPDLGAIVTVNIGMNTDNYINNAVVIPRTVRRNTDGTVCFSILDKQTNTVREIRARNLVFLTGPGVEITKVASGGSQALYQRSLREIEETLTRARAEIARLRRQITDGEAYLSPLGAQRLRNQVEAKICKVGANIPLPKVLTLRSLELIYNFWDFDLGADPRAFPLKVLLSGKRVAIVGFGDTAKVIAAILNGRAPEGAYPEGFEVAEAEIDFYGVKAGTKIRRRYEGDLIYFKKSASEASKVNYIKEKATSYRLLLNGKVAVAQENGSESQYDVVFDCSGLTPERLEDQFPNALDIVDIYNEEDNSEVVARGTTDLAVVIAGTATGFTAPDLPYDVRQIIRILGIGENTKAMWANGPLVEAVFWLISSRIPHTKRL